MAIFRDFRKGDVLTVHLMDGTTCAGVFLRSSRNFLRLSAGKIEANGALRDLLSERLHVPRQLIKLVEVVSA